MPLTGKPQKKLKPGDGLYGVKKLQSKAPSALKPWAVVNLETGDVNGRWHATEADAKKQLAAMYASMGSKALKHSEISYIVPVKKFSDSTGKINWVDGNKLWIQMYPYDTWGHPFYGETTVNKDIAEKMVKNFTDGVTGRKQIVEYDHGKDPAKGGKAAGEILKTEARDDGLFGFVQFNDIAKKEIEDGEWNYWSTTHYDAWTHPQTNETYEFVPDGGSLTNKPYVRGMLPLNFSEVMLENPELLVHEVVDEEPEPVPPVIEPKPDDDDKGGEEVPVDDKPDAANELEKALRARLSIGNDIDLVAHVGAMDDELGPLRELKKEHSEKARFSEAFPAEAAKLAELEKRDQENFAKNFSDTFLDARVTRKTKKEGSDDEFVTEKTGLGFSALVIENIREMAKEFSEGNAKFETTKKVLDSILDNGVVDYGTHGSSREVELEDETAPPKDFSDARKQFSDKVTAIQEQDKLEFDAAYAKAAVDNPELFKAYKEKKPVATAAS